MFRIDPRACTRKGSYLKSSFFAGNVIPRTILMADSKIALGFVRLSKGLLSTVFLSTVYLTLLIPVPELWASPKGADLPPAWTSGETEVEPKKERDPKTGKWIKAEKEKWEPRTLARYRSRGFDPISVLRAQPFQVKNTKRGASCLRELRRLGISYKPGPNVRGIHTPILLSGKDDGVKVGGIKYKAHYGGRKPLMDCRMALALYRAAPIIRAAGFKTIYYWGFYSYRRVHGSRHLSRHAYGMAIDIARLSGDENLNVTVKDDWEKIRGTPGKCVGSPRSVDAARLRSMICRLESLQVFRRILTPDSDYAHRDHFHMSAPKSLGTKWKRNRYCGRKLKRKLPGNRRPKRRYRNRKQRRRQQRLRRRRLRKQRQRRQRLKRQRLKRKRKKKKHKK